MGLLILAADEYRVVEAITEEIGCGLLRDLYDYWNSRRGERRFPRRSDIDPLHIPRLLPHVLLVDVEREAEIRFHYRLVGSYIEAAFQQWLTGRPAKQLKAESELNNILARMRECVETGRPVISTHVFVNEDRRHFDYRRLLLPLAVSVDERVDMILGGICFRLPLPTRKVPFGRKLEEQDGVTEPVAGGDQDGLRTPGIARQPVGASWWSRSLPTATMLAAGTRALSSFSRR